MRGAGRTPRGLRAQQQTSRAAGGANRSVALTTPAKASRNKIEHSANASQNRQPTAEVNPATSTHTSGMPGPRHQSTKPENEAKPTASHQQNLLLSPTSKGTITRLNDSKTSAPGGRYNQQKGSTKCPFKQGHSRTEWLIRRPHPGQDISGDLVVEFFGFSPSPPPSAIGFKGCRNAGVYGRRPAGARKQQQLQIFFRSTNTQQTIERDIAIATRSRKGVLVYM